MIRHYLDILAETLLIRLVDPLNFRLKKKRGNPKIIAVPLSTSMPSR
jgi:hypothetical protein